MPRPRTLRPQPLLAALTGLVTPLPVAALLLWACDGADELEDAMPTAEVVRAAAEPAEAAAEAVGRAEVAAAAELAPPAAAEPAPSGVRISSRTTIVYAAPRYGSEMRGRIDPGAPFAIYGLVEGTGCPGEGWARGGPRDGDGFVCLKAAEVSDAAPEVQPVIPEGLVVPFLYAKPKADRKGVLLAEVPRWRTRYALTSGREPVDFLEPNRQYAFVDLRPLPGHGKIYEDADEQVVLAKDMKAEKPSEFSGRILASAPVGEGRRAAWCVSHEAGLRAEPRMKSPIVAALEWHQSIEVLPEMIRGGGGRWISIPDGLGPDVPAFIEVEKVRWFEPGPELDGVAEGETWIDVDLGQQMLAVMRGDEPIFLTLISSGTGSKPNTSTPRGVYRIRNKLALGAMRNRPEDAEESPYHVEAVPWVQYFYRRFALHGAYWHDGFGHRKSHGCVNLAPKDARYVYGLTTPEVPPGWLSSYEHAGEIGSVVRVRKGQEVGEDRRTINDVEPDAPPSEAALAEPTL